MRYTFKDLKEEFIKSNSGCNYRLRLVEHTNMQTGKKGKSIYITRINENRSNRSMLIPVGIIDALLKMKK